MKAEGLSTHTLSDRTKKRVSHSAIAAWLKGTNRASLEQVQHVATVFGWDAHELLYGRATPETVDRLAEMDAELRTVRRAVTQALPALMELAGVAPATEGAGAVPAKPHPGRRDRASGE